MIDPSESAPSLECDLVMKGGVTSGIIYPAAIAAIARTYRLRAIGGTSAGAIGAAAAAAMEFGRRSGRNPQADGMMASLASQLGEKKDGSPLLLRLFEPDPGTARLFRLVVNLATTPQDKRIGTALWLLFGLPFLIAFCVVTGLVAFLSWQAPDPHASAHVISMILLVCFAMPCLTFLLAAARWIPKLMADLAAVVDNGFGFCSGMAEYRTPARRWRLPWRQRPEPARAPSLSDWLHEQFQRLAGLPDNEVLTFGDLWAAEHRSVGRERAEAFTLATQREYERRNQPRPAEDVEVEEERPIPTLDRIPRDIELALVASDINRAQSMQFPFMRREDRLYARISDLRALFPDAVVQWMIDHARSGPDIEEELHRLISDADERADFIRLPLPQDLPILFGVRASLSFPFLFRAVRLFVVRPVGDGSGRQRLDEIWLADGGITSNFPIHLFDAPIPGRPTFCLNLLYHDDEFAPESAPSTGGPADQAESAPDAGLPVAMAATGNAATDELIYMLRSNSGRLSAYTRFRQGSAINRLMRFGGRIVTTARQWGDNQLIDVPGYRDRIVHIRMLPDEGGFNFNMSDKLIAGLQLRGQRAGEVIAERFDPKTVKDPLHPDERLALNWANHRFVRFRSFLAGLEVATSRFAETWTRDCARAELPTSDPGYVMPSIEQMAEELSPSNSDPFPQKVGYPFRNNQQADLALDMVKALNALRELADDTAWRGVDFIKGQGSSPRPKSMLKLRPPADTDPFSDRP